MFAFFKKRIVIGGWKDVIVVGDMLETQLALADVAVGNKMLELITVPVKAR